ncbi:hypothetical protein [Fluviicola taffensis]|uniref:hypothetical protein n=1 Tax=Fluviicola taffensis TaxID=191579 RepID=UPI003138281C
MISKLIFGMLFMSSLFFVFSCGITGKITSYDFDVSKDSLELAVNQFLAKNELYRFPKNDPAWKAYAPEDSVIDYQLIDGVMVHKYKKLTNIEVYFYFKDEPEEVYEMKYYMNKEYWDNHPFNSSLMLISVVEKGGKWRYSDPVFNRFFRGRKRVEKRLEEEVLKKLPYKYKKAA